MNEDLPEIVKVLEIDDLMSEFKNTFNLSISSLLNPLIFATGVFCSDMDSYAMYTRVFDIYPLFLTLRMNASGLAD